MLERNTFHTQKKGIKTMWESIISSLSSSFAESLCTKYLDSKSSEEFEQGLSAAIEKTFNKFADTSLDRDEFARFVMGPSFVEALQHYFFSMDEDDEKPLYMSAFIDYLCKQCPSIDRLDATEFIRAIETVYTTYLEHELNSSPTLGPLYRLLIRSQKSLLRSILRSQEDIKNYFTMIHDRDVEISDEDIQQYHSVCMREYGTIRFTGISGIESKASQNINDFYVENSFTLFAPDNSARIYDSNQKEPVLGLRDLFSGNNRVVLIGGAGLGKSTSLNYLFCNYEELYKSNALKLKINLREYAADISERHNDIIWCLATEFSKHTAQRRLSFDNIRSMLKDILIKGKCLVIFDALDEIPTQESRNRVRDEISNFCELYYLNRFIISSREVGYLKNRFDSEFVHIRINEFNMEQIEKYSSNWFKTNHKDADFSEFWDKFKQEVERAKCQNLIGNPIILILALVIFDIQNSLPNRRVEFYKKCIDTFLISREDRKGTVIQGDSFKNILGDNSVVPKVAHYKFEKTTEDMAYRFTLDELKEAVMQAIDVPNRRQWVNPVAQYAKYLIDRTELIREIDEDDYDFAHKTFYEYFLAVYYAQECSAEDLTSQLDIWIGDANNDEMARLIIEVIVEKNDARQHKAIIEYLFDKLDDPTNRESTLSILVELYNHNVLRAKFHDQYYNCILNHSYLVNLLELRFAHLSDDHHYEHVRYDECRTAELFLQHVNADAKYLYDKVAAIRNLNAEFRHKLIKISNDALYKRISTLFNCSSVLSNKPSRQLQLRQESFNCFTHEYLDLTLNSPPIYLSLIPHSLDKEYSEIRELFNFAFNANSLFTHYISPSTLLQILYKSCDSAENMLLFLIASIHCSKQNTIFLLLYIIREHKFMRTSSRERNKAAYERAIIIWKKLFENCNFDGWKSWLTEVGLYLPQHEELYHKLCDEYLSNEADEEDDRKYMEGRLYDTDVSRKR